MTQQQTLTAGQAAVRALAEHGVAVVFGIPGAHTLELYRGLAATPPVRHITARHEGGAGFMADGYARVSGRPGVCLVITGPGVTNAATALGQAYSDSSPVLCLSSVNPAGQPAGGRLHELKSQVQLTAQVCAWSEQVRDAAAVPGAIARAMAAFATGRPRPVHLEIPTDVLAQAAPAEVAPAVPTAPVQQPAPAASALDAAAALLRAARRPALIAGGGAAGAAAQVRALAERLGAVVVHTSNGKGTVPEDHPLCVGCGLHLPPVLNYLQGCDAVVAVGTELAPTDLWEGPLQLAGALIRIDIDPEALRSGPPARVAIGADAALACGGLLERLDAAAPAGAQAAAAQAVAAMREQVVAAETPDQQRHRQLWQALRGALAPDAVVVTDMAQVAYSGLHQYPTLSPRGWLHPTGFGCLGFALPAAIGAKLAAPHRQVVALAGDGGFLFTGQELLTAVQERLPLPVLVHNNGGYGEIARGMQAAGIPPVGVNLATPDFVALGRACGARAQRVERLADLPGALAEAFTASGPTLLEIPDGQKV